MGFETRTLEKEYSGQTKICMGSPVGILNRKKAKPGKANFLELHRTISQTESKQAFLKNVREAASLILIWILTRKLVLKGNEYYSIFIYHKQDPYTTVELCPPHL